MRVLVIGAAGHVGRAVVDAALARGDEVVVASRDPTRLRAAFPDARVQVAVAETRDVDALSAAAARTDAAVYTVGLPYTKKDFAQYPAAMRAVTEALCRAGTGTLVQIGNVYVYGPPRTPLVTEDHPLEPTAVKGRYRLEQERATLAADGRDGLRSAVLRLPDFLDGPTAFPGRTVGPALAGSRAQLLGPADTPHEFVFTPDVGPVVLGLLSRPDLLGRAYNMAGSGHTTTEAVVRMIYAEAGHPYRATVLPPAAVRLAGLAVPLMRELSELSYLRQEPVLMLDESRLVAALGTVVHTPYEQAVRQMVAQERAARSTPR